LKANIYSHTVLIGTAELYIGDESMGCVFGEFIPENNYYQSTQKLIWDFWKAKKSDYKKIISLRLNAQLENGYFLYPVGGITIEDSRELPNEPKLIDIAGLDRHVINDFFLTKTSKTFIEKPWEKINIEQKIAFEEELYNELGLTKKSIFDFIIPKKDKHELADFKFSALCKYRCNDDVLFVARKQGFEKQFAVIHLTWKNKQEVEGFPGVEFFKDFNEFQNLRMYPDINEWED
jgi:hypothetical protein